MNGLARTDLRSLGALLIVGIGSGSAFMFTKVAVEDLAPLQLVLARVATALLPVVAVMAYRKTWPTLTRRLLSNVAILALLDAVLPYTLIAWAGSRIDSSTSALVVSTMPLFTTVIAAATLRAESLAPTAVLGLLVGFAGVVVLAGSQALGVGANDGPAILAVLLASFCYAAGAVYAKVLLRTGDPISLTGLKIATATLILLPLTAAVDGFAAYGSMSWETVGAVTALGFGATGICRCIYLWIVATAGSIQASLVTYIVPVVGLMLGWAVLDEALSAEKLAGAALIVLGIGATMYGHQTWTWLKNAPAARVRHSTTLQPR